MSNNKKNNTTVLSKNACTFCQEDRTEFINLQKKFVNLQRQLSDEKKKNEILRNERNNALTTIDKLQNYNNQLMDELKTKTASSDDTLKKELFKYKNGCDAIEKIIYSLNEFCIDANQYNEYQIWFDKEIADREERYRNIVCIFPPNALSFIKNIYTVFAHRLTYRSLYVLKLHKYYSEVSENQWKIAANYLRVALIQRYYADLLHWKLCRESDKNHQCFNNLAKGWLQDFDNRIKAKNYVIDQDTRDVLKAAFDKTKGYCFPSHNYRSSFTVYDE